MNFEVKNPNNLPVLDYRQILELQNSDEGNLKDLSQEDYDRLKLSIEENGFFLPFFLWQHENVFYALDGHQRLAVLNNEEAEPFELPYLLVEADTLVEAKQKLLLITSQYGKMTEDGLRAFSLELDQGWVNSRTTFQGLKPLNIALKRDLLTVPETSGGEAPPPAAGSKPSASHNDYSVYETLMLHEQKLLLLNVLNDILSEHPEVENQAGALFFLAQHYQEAQSPV